MSGLDCHFLPAPFRFCLRCGVSYGFRISDRLRQAGDPQLRGPQHRDDDPRPDRHPGPAREESLARAGPQAPHASPTTARTPASRPGTSTTSSRSACSASALYKAVRDAGPDGLTHDDLTQKVFDALDLPVELYAFEPGRPVRGGGRDEAGAAGRARLPALSRPPPRLAGHLAEPGAVRPAGDPLPVARRGLRGRGRLAGQAPGPGLGQPRDPPRGVAGAARLHAPGAGDQGRLPGADGPGADPAPEQPAAHRHPGASTRTRPLDYAAVLYPRPNRGYQEDRSNVYLSARGGFGLYLGRRTTFPNLPGAAEAGRPPADDPRPPGGAAGGGPRRGGRPPTLARRRPRLPDAGLGPALGGRRRHPGVPRPDPRPRRPPRRAAGPTRSSSSSTRPWPPRSGAWRPASTRPRCRTRSGSNREERFRDGRLPVLFCSPTMELGVDIAELNVVEHAERPADPGQLCPAERPGRPERPAGPGVHLLRDGQPARPVLLQAARPDGRRRGHAAGLDLANEDLVRAHVHAIWLAETGARPGQLARATSST